METMQQAILDFFGNKKLLKNIRTGAVIILLLLIPIVYFGYRASFTFAALFSWDFGSAIVVITLSIFLATMETKSFAYDITIDLDQEIKDLEIKVESNGDIIRSNDANGKKSVSWCNKYNKDQQKMYDEIKTNDRIAIYEKRALNARVNGNEKRALKYDKLIKNLKKNGLRDKHFKPYNIKRIMGVDRIGVKLAKKKGDNEISSNPKKINFITILLGMPIRALGIGVIGTIPFVWSGSPETVFLFYISYLLAIIITVVSQYLITSYKTTYGYKKSLKTINGLQTLLLQHIGYENNIETQLESLPFDDKEKDTN